MNIFSKLLLCFIIVSLVGFSLYSYVEYDWETSPTQQISQGKLSSNITDISYKLLNYTISYSSSYKYLTVSSKRSTLFSNNQGHSFFFCGVGNAFDENNSGIWYFKDHYNQICKDQIIERITQISSNEILITGYFSDCTVLDKFQFSIQQNNEKILLSGTCLSPIFNRSLIEMSSHKEENIFGFGEHSGEVNMKGEIISTYVRERGLFRSKGIISFLADLFANNAGGKPYYSYYPAPLFLTSDFRGCFVLNDNYNIFDMTRLESIKIMVWSPQISLYLFDENTLPRLITELTKLTGRMKPLPDWIMNGGVVAITGGSEKLRSSYERLKKFNTRLAGIWTQDWSGKRMDGQIARLWWNWQLDENYYPEWKNMTEELMNNGIRRLTYINPMLHNISGFLNNSMNFFEIAAQNNYLLKDLNNEVIYYILDGFKAGIMDFSNPKAKEFYKQIIKQHMFNESKSFGFMADFGEDVPIDNVLYTNPSDTGDAMHNTYPYNLPMVCSEAAQEYFGSNDEIVFFTRSGFKYSPNYTRLAWTGDHLENWEKGNGIKSALKAMINLGLSGAQFSHTDVGGYIYYNFHGILSIGRSEELLMRWIELGAFSVVFRTHEGTAPESTPQVYSTDKMAEFFSNFTKIYLSWKEYRVFLMKEAYETGLPVLRHMMIHYSHNRNAYNLNKQFLIGEDLLIAPVLDEGAEKVEVYLSNDINGRSEEWIHLWNQQTYTSCDCWKTIDAPVGKPAVFYKKNSIWGNKMVQYLINNEF